MSAIRRRFPATRTLLGVGFLAVCFFWITHDYALNLSSSARGGNWKLDVDDSTGLKPPFKGGARSVGYGMVDSNLRCTLLPNAKDVLVVMKTGSTEMIDKLPVHIRTTLKCYPSHVIYSDFDETYHGEVIYDVLKGIDSELTEKHPDFELHRRLKNLSAVFPGVPPVPAGRNALKPSELSGPLPVPQSNMGKQANPGWRLDKWKFLPMMSRTLKSHPDKKWYVFVETDTFIFWQTLLNYLAAIDETQPYYIGGQIWIGDIVFAHGGSGFAVSKPALEKVVHNYETYEKDWTNFTNTHWAGDCVLGKAMKNSGTSLTYAWPIWQGDAIGKMNYERVDNSHRLWCMPTVSYHHVSPATVDDLFRFEQEWILKTRGDTKKHLTHRDVFREYILPRTKRPKMDWDNHADEDQGPAETVAECLRICFADTSCLQYRLTAEMRCMTSSKPSLGEGKRGVESGWIHDRLQKWYDAQAPCGEDEGAWIV